MTAGVLQTQEEVGVQLLWVMIQMLKNVSASGKRLRSCIVRHCLRLLVSSTVRAFLQVCGSFSDMSTLDTFVRLCLGEKTQQHIPRSSAFTEHCYSGKQNWLPADRVLSKGSLPRPRTLTQLKSTCVHAAWQMCSAEVCQCDYTGASLPDQLSRELGRSAAYLGTRSLPLWLCSPQRPRKIGRPRSRASEAVSPNSLLPKR